MEPSLNGRPWRRGGSSGILSLEISPIASSNEGRLPTSPPGRFLIASAPCEEGLFGLGFLFGLEGPESGLEGFTLAFMLGGVPRFSGYGG